MDQRAIRLARPAQRVVGMGSLGCTAAQLFVLFASISSASNRAVGAGHTTNVSYRFNLAPAPSPFAHHQGYYNSSTWSWGGALIHVPDDVHGNFFHSAYMCLRGALLAIPRPAGAFRLTSALLHVL